MIETIAEGNGPQKLWKRSHAEIIGDGRRNASVELAGGLRREEVEET
jgi:hypothetical protein